MKKINRVISLLNKYYSSTGWVKKSDPIDELILTVISQNTSWHNTYRAYTRLRKNFSDWEEVASSPLRKIQKSLRPGGLYRQKARYIKEILNIIKQREGKISLERLKKMDTDGALKYLLSLPGVGEKTAKCVILFSLGKPTLPVDTHIFRVSTRIGLIGRNSNIKQAHEKLAKIVPPDFYFDFHTKMIIHGRRYCKPHNPLCEECFLRDVCDYFKSGKT